MSALVIGAAILAFTALQAGPALLGAAGRARNTVFDLAWPLSLWLVWLVLLFMLVPETALVAEEARTTALAASCAAVSLVYAPALGQVWWRMRRGGV